MSAITDVFVSLGGASAVGLAASRVWSWWATRDTADRDARAKAAERKAAADDTAQRGLIDALKANAESADARATSAAEGRAAVAAAMTAQATAVNELADVIGEHTRAVTAAQQRACDDVAAISARLATLEAQHGEILATLRRTGEHPTARGVS